MIFKETLTTHKKIKNNLLNLIDKIPMSCIKSSGEHISKTDWNLSEEFKREYLNIFYDNIKTLMNRICKRLNTNKWQIHNTWFQQYEINDWHDWHNHERTNFSAVYYLELPNEQLNTKFFNNKEVKVSEGDVLFFPGFLLHRSPINKYSRKTIIAFNCSFTEWNGTVN